MNYLELQQRANILVNKVNEYESNLTGQTIDESEILDQHLYADIYSLRPVMKMLFGKDLTEKLNRTLENDVDLKVYALNSPLNRTSFSLLSSYNPYPLTRKLSELITPVGSISYDDEGWTNIAAANSGYYTANVSDFLPDLNSPVEYRKLKIYYKRQTSYITSFPIEAIDSNNNRNSIIPCRYSSSSGGWVMSAYPFGLTAGAGNRIMASNIEIGTEILVEVTIKPIPDEANDTYKDGCFYYADYTVSNANTGEVYGKSTSPYYIISLVWNSSPVNLPIKQIQLGYFNSTYNRGWSLNVEKSTVEIYKTSFEEGYVQEVVHDNVISLDTYNSHNMLIQDAYVNTIVDRDTRIKAGINYSYSSNIQDALVTESQVANLFKWNTTTSLDISNNSMSINRQVPGIVVYYLGTDYDSTYTATIPYNPGSLKLNQINYSTPPYYGAYYMTDETQSQIGLQMGAEACRIFMPGLNYTRGQLESPQQIWQPDRLVGQSNVGLGYNWQGGSVYHELVFKNRRSGAQEADVDFIAPVESDIDNDPQGLALRTALAQQKPFYYNRLWFSELDELYGANMEKLAEQIENVTYSVPPTTNYTKVGNPTITEDYILTSASDGNYLEMIPDDFFITTNDGNTTSLKLRFNFTTGSTISASNTLFGEGKQSTPQGATVFILAPRTDGTDGPRLVQAMCDSSHNGHYTGSINLENNKSYSCEVTWNSDSIRDLITTVTDEDGTVQSITATAPSSSPGGFSSYMSTFGFRPKWISDGGYPLSEGAGTLDLKSIEYEKNGEVVYQSYISQEPQHFQNDTEYFNYLKLPYDVWATALDKPL